MYLIQQYTVFCMTNITGKHLYLIARTLKTTSEFLLKPVFYEEIDFGLFRSNVCHFAKHYGKDYIDILIQENDIRTYDFTGHKGLSLYLLGMVDCLCHKYNISLTIKFSSFQTKRRTVNTGCYKNRPVIILQHLIKSLTSSFLHYYSLHS